MGFWRAGSFSPNPPTVHGKRKFHISSLLRKSSERSYHLCVSVQLRKCTGAYNRVLVTADQLLWSKSSSDSASRNSSRSAQRYCGEFSSERLGRKVQTTLVRKCERNYSCELHFEAYQLGPSSTADLGVGSAARLEHIRACLLRSSEEAHR